MRVGIVGCGLIGRKRAEALTVDDVLVACHDADPAAADRLARDFGAEADGNLDSLLARDLDVVVVATWHNQLAGIAERALESGAHVLVEKPAGVNTAEIAAIDVAARSAGRRVKVGFNHRFAPGIRQAVEVARSGRFGDVMFARARYGHGGRIGYEGEWRMRPEISGGGELVDQGMHVLDIFHWLLGPLPLHSALLRTQFWQAPVEDNAVLTVADPSSESGPWGTAHVTWTEWKNMFSLEIYCRTGKLDVAGLAGSYGPQSLTIHAMLPEMGPPETEVITYPQGDPSWTEEWLHFRTVISQAGGDSELLGDLASARYAWECIERARELQAAGR
jgi:predicted dehydrogenase